MSDWLWNVWEILIKLKHDVMTWFSTETEHFFHWLTVYSKKCVALLMWSIWDFFFLSMKKLCFSSLGFVYMFPSLSHQIYWYHCSKFPFIANTWEDLVTKYGLEIGNLVAVTVVENFFMKLCWESFCFVHYEQSIWSGLQSFAESNYQRTFSLYFM